MSTRKRGQLKPKGALSPKSESVTLAVLRNLVQSLATGDAMDMDTAERLCAYFKRLDVSRNLVGLSVFQHNISKLLRINEGVEVLHELILNSANIKRNVRKDPRYGLELMKILYREANISNLLLGDGKTRLFERDGVGKALKPPVENDDAESTISPKSRARITRVITQLLDGDEEDEEEEEDEDGIEVVVESKLGGILNDNDNDK